MKGLATLVRLHRWQVDERRREVADLERLIAQLQGEAERLVEELKTEQAAAKDSDSANRAYGPYAQTIAVKQRRLATTIAEVEVRAVAARESLAEAFRELKRHEMTLAERERRAKVALERKNQVALDEIGLNIHRHRRRPPAG